jgi:enamine deaminase RidA (YjgF/YER057c/UK114 family)
MSRQRISSGSTFEEQIGYSRAVVDGDWVFVAGTTGYDYATMTISPDVVEQADQCCRNIAAALEQAGSAMVSRLAGVASFITCDGVSPLDLHQRTE